MSDTTPFDKVTVAEAVQILFEIKLAQYPKFKDSINTLLKLKGFINLEAEAGVQRRKVFIYKNQLNKLHNAILLQAFFKPRLVQAIIESSKERFAAADAIELLMLDRQSILGICLLSPEVISLVNVLRDNIDITQSKLPNPFIELPQLSLDGVTNIMKELVTQSAALSQGETMIVNYLNGELEQAFLHASQLHSDNPVVQNFKNKIITEYHQAEDFDSTLDFFK